MRVVLQLPADAVATPDGWCAGCGQAPCNPGPRRDGSCWRQLPIAPYPLGFRAFHDDTTTRERLERQLTREQAVQFWDGVAEQASRRAEGARYELARRARP